MLGKLIEGVLAEELRAAKALQEQVSHAAALSSNPEESQNPPEVSDMRQR